ncbi:xylose ABC transporter ATP-binding protein [Pectobacterium sp. FL60-S17]|uniref:Xylose ABC transporter ATP-binding protein n=1 Tax=Pectobacterium quasiaquaticum TaxID=2774015 RepID=A0A9Q2ID65_9GAMM|nr:MULTISPECIES: xylose ABC transporter ATP-binding protein [Pectobacterium]MBE5201773.1 xylose ABC transporter ATP-binding protein [Pectobacterium quasiaquaticum]MBE5210088.1 xylose ABC transporter ATP-binding protein [Pectobacterium quasiaquaticum]MBE5222942.1 xylose ABC transporter ATP-binding protein [Pectobacterium quasiaquaticum]MBN3064957.1 xylose ABC transporter ATP-binding protein [Pectobacterium aquaticum]URG51079.1 xylose ABC transporter ATP-binding protein [Pectobacterium quasiaqua
MPHLLEMKNITKAFGTVKAVDNVSLMLDAGQVLSLCGENGSGKSTLMKVLCGIYPYGSYDGQIVFSGDELRANHIRDTEQKGIAIIHQELALVKEMTVLENLFLGNEWTRFGVMDYDNMYLRCQRMLEQVKLAVDPNTKVGELGLGQQQLVEIAKALNKQVRLLVLDEPTASLTERETAILLEIIQDLRDHGIACIYISHKLNEVKAISDVICVIRDGKPIGMRPAAELSEDQIIAMMVGRELTELYPNEPHVIGEEVLRVEHLTAWHPVNRHIRRVDGVSFALHRGEILGIAGLVGSGRTETVQCLFGAYHGRWQGDIFIDGEKVTISNCQQAMAQGIAMVPEDRKKDGIVPVMSVAQNMTLAALDQFTGAFSMLDDAREQDIIRQSLANLKVKTSSPELAIARLSGGNQQKAVLAKCLLLNPRILILDEPTRGIDIGAKYEIYKLINALVKQHIAVIVISSELPEVLGLSDRVLVMHQGRIKADLINRDLTQEQVMEAALRSEHRAENIAV